MVGEPETISSVNIRDSTFDVMRQLGMTRIFGNPGSTEVAFLTDLPPDLEFVLGLHEGTVVGMATGYAIGRGSPAFVNLHTAPGLGNGINAIANARDCHAPLVVVVGQQDRRQLASSPFLAGRALERVAGEYPVWSSLPARPQDVPGAIARAYHEAVTHRGPALVVAPMGDWEQEVDPLAVGAPASVLRPGGVDADELGALLELIARREAPCSWSAPAPRATPAGSRSRRSPRRSEAPSGRRRSGAVPASRRPIRCSPGTCRGCARGCTRRSLRTIS